MIYNANNQNDPGHWGPSQSESIDIKTALKTHKKPLLIIGAVVLVILSALFWMGVYASMNDSGSSSSSSGSLGVASGSLYDDEFWTMEEMAYLDLMYEAQAEDGITGTGFANHQYAVIHGHTVCELLDTYYVEDIADSLSRNSDGILYKVSNKTKAYGIVAASIHLCNEHAPEVHRWMN